MPDVLLTFDHGLGDAVQLTIVLQHLRRWRPRWTVDVFCRRGKHTALAGLCRRAYHDHEPRPDESAYDRVYPLDWWECHERYEACPSTKPFKCLKEVFGIAPDPALFRYRIQIGSEARDRSAAYLASITPHSALRTPNHRFPVMLLHYEGNTSADRKNLSHDTARQLCRWAELAGLVPVILDWDRRSPLPDGVKIHCPTTGERDLWGNFGSGDAEILAALIDQAELMIGIDSGPLHVAGATSTPAIGIWTGHNPVHFFDVADNVYHLHREGAALTPFFAQHCRHGVHKLPDVTAIVEQANALTGRSVAPNQVGGNPMRDTGPLQSTSFDRAYYDEHKQAGLDYLNFGPWQVNYATWLIESLGLAGKTVLDVGAACGSIAWGFRSQCHTVGIDVNNHMIELGRKKYAPMPLYVCDSVNLHLFGDGDFDFIHSAQVAEHFKPELVPFILREWHRVLAPGGLIFCALDTVELFARQGRTLATEDPTHVCVRPLAWWHEQLAAAGFTDARPELEAALTGHAQSYFKLYDWDWFLVRKPLHP